MFPTLALAAALSLAPAQNGALDITNVRITFGGEFGPPRPDANLLPGDVLFLAYEIENLKLDEFGKAQYNMSMEVTDSAGKPFYTMKPTDMEMLMPFGGPKLPGRAFVKLGLDQPKGVYSCKITVTDRVTKASKVIEKSFNVLDPDFGAVALVTSSDPGGELACPMGGVVGQPLWLCFWVVNFGRDATTKDPYVVTEIRVLDQNKKPVNEKPLTYETKKTAMSSDTFIPHSIPMPLTCAGVFTVELKAECKLTGKRYSMSFPITVTPAAR